MNIQKEMDFQELIHAIMEVGTSTICRVGWQAGDPENAGVQVQRLSAAEFLLAGERLVFVQFNPVTDWMSPTHIMELNLLDS